MAAAGLLYEVRHPRTSSSPALACASPDIVAFSGGTIYKQIKKFN